MTRKPAGDTEPIRLNHFLSTIGIASRRACDDLIATGHVRVGGHVVRELGTKIVPGQDVVTVDGSVVGTPPRRLVFLMHKPKGVVSTVSDPEGRTTVVDLCRRIARRDRLFPVGRLDVNTTGALLITNDGLLCYRLTHPRFEIPRVYQVRVRGDVSDTQLHRLDVMARDAAAGARSRPGHTLRGGVKVVKQLPREAVIQVTLLEGKNRQVRNMCDAVRLRITELKRVSFGPVSIRGLPLGTVRPLERRELVRLDAMLAAQAKAGAGK